MKYDGFDDVIWPLLKQREHDHLIKPTSYPGALACAEDLMCECETLKRSTFWGDLTPWLAAVQD